MSQLNVGSINLTSGTVTTPGGMKLSTFTNTTRPSSSQIGSLIYNSDEEVAQLWTGTEWMNVGSSRKLNGSSEAKAAPNISTLIAAGVSTDGNYWIKPSGSNLAIQTYVNFSNAPSGYAYVLVARGRESTDWWNNAGQNYTTGLLSGSLAVNTPIAVAPGDWVNNLIGGNWNRAKFLANRLNSSDSFYFEGTSSAGFNWVYYQQSASSVNATAQRYNNLWKNGLALNYNSGNQWTDTLNYGNGNNCDRTFTWSWGGHGSYQGWSGGSSCTPSGGFTVGGEGHSIQLVNVYMLIN